MTTPFVCILIALLLIHAPRVAYVVALKREGKRYNNKAPRSQQRRAKGLAARALAAHNNGFETFTPFAAGVFVAHLGGADPRQATVLAVSFILCRVFYIVAYLGNADYLRTAVWVLGLLATCGLFVLPML